MQESGRDAKMRDKTDPCIEHEANDLVVGKRQDKDKASTMLSADTTWRYAEGSCHMKLLKTRRKQTKETNSSHQPTLETQALPTEHKVHHDNHVELDVRN